MTKNHIKSAVIFGAGNIGRSFIGNIFASNGYEVTFIDANQELIDRLNNRGIYTVLIKRNTKPDEAVVVSGIKAVHSANHEKVMEALCRCSICSTSVGQGALKFVVPQLAEAVKKRIESDLPPLDIIIAENIRNGADFFRGIFRANGLTGKEAGLIETSIGKMVPIMTAHDLEDDPLILHAEEYNTLIIDGKGFRNEAPTLPEIKAVENVSAWVDRKLFIHNLGHAASAYYGFETYPERELIADVIIDPEINRKVRAAMKESAAALLAEYPEDFTKQALDEHIEDLLYRFENKALGDTVFRVGRDLYRKLNRNDRVLGAASLCLKHELPCIAILDVFKAAVRFKAKDGNNRMFEKDNEFHNKLSADGIKEMLQRDLGLKSSDETLKKRLLKIF